MNNNLITQLQTAIKPLAAKLGVGAKYAWAVTYKQQYICGITDLVWFFIFGIITIVGLKVIFYLLKKIYNPETDWQDKEPLWMGVIIGSIFTGICCIVSLFLINNSIHFLMNPGFYTLQSFLHGGS